MGAAQTVLPFKLGATGESLTAHGGLALFGEYLRAMDVGVVIDHELPGPGSAAGYDPSAHVLPLVLMLAGGGRTLEDLRVLRNDTGLRSLLQLDDMPSSDATGDWLRRMGATASDGLKALQRVNRGVFRRLLRRDERTGYTLDIDATQIVAEKREAHYTYEPLAKLPAGYGREACSPVTGWFRDRCRGNRAQSGRFFLTPRASILPLSRPWRDFRSFGA